MRTNFHHLPEYAATAADADEVRQVQEYEGHLHAFVTTLASKWRVPGVAVELSANGWRAGAAVGTAAADHSTPMSSAAHFELGLLSEFLLALIVLNLAAQRKLNVHASVSTYLPELAGTRVGSAVTLGNLLSHTEGYRWSNQPAQEAIGDYSWHQCVDALAHAEFLFEPGTVFSFTPVAGVLLKEIVKRVTGCPAETIVRDRLLSQLGIAGSPHVAALHNYDVTKRKFVGVAPPTRSRFWWPFPSNITLSVSDWIMLLELLLDARQSATDINQLISATAASLLQTPVVTLPFCTDGHLSERSPRTACLGAFEYNPGWQGHSGPRFGQAVTIRYHTTSRVAIAVGVNARTPFLCDTVAEEIMRSLGAVDAVEPRAISADLPRARELPGTYQGTNGLEVRLVPENGHIVCQLASSQGHLGTSVALRLDGDRWACVSDPGPVSVGVFRDPSSAAPCLMLGNVAYRKR